MGGGSLTCRRMYLAGPDNLASREVILYFDFDDMLTTPFPSNNGAKKCLKGGGSAGSSLN